MPLGFKLFSLFPVPWPDSRPNWPIVVEGAGFEPAKPFRTPDLQSGGFNHSPTPPGFGQSSLPLAAPRARYSGVGKRVSKRAPEGNRTPNLSITNRLRYLCATGASRALGGRHTTNGPVCLGPFFRDHLAESALYKMDGGKSIGLKVAHARKPWAGFLIIRPVKRPT